MKSLCFGLPAAAALFLSGLAPSSLVAADVPSAATKAPAASRAPAAPPHANADAKNPGGADLYQLPPGDDVNALFAFIKRVSDFEPNTNAEAMEYHAKGPLAVEAACEKILRLEKDPQSRLAQLASMVLMDVRVNNVQILSLQKQRELVDSALKPLKAGAFDKDDLRLAKTLATNLEFDGDPALAAEAYAGIAKVLAASDNESLREMAVKFEGAHRRLTSVGKPLPITGQTIDGKPFDWTKYRGKVVLVDFWATWCKPCRDEMPNIRKNYEKYRAQGFEVVGISVDEDRQELLTFLAKEKLPWVILQDGVNTDPTKTSMENYYGVFGFPFTLLVDKQGNVIAMQAHGETLGPQIEKALQTRASTTSKPPASKSAASASATRK